MAKSISVVVPPKAAARVPVSKSSALVVPPKGMSRWVWGSIPPGMTYLPEASMVRSTLVPLSLELRSVPTREIFSPSMSTSAAKRSAAVATVPFLIRVFMERPRLSGKLLDHRLVRLRAPVPEELPGAPDLLDHVQVEVGDDQLVL